MRTALTVLAALLTAAALAQPASAGTASVAPCSSPEYTINDILPNGYGSLFDIEVACPDISVTMFPYFGPLPEGERGTAARVVPSNLIGVDVTVAGGPAADSGIEIRLMVCSFDECGRAISPTGSPTPFDDHLSVGDGIPEDPQTILLEAVCTKPDCFDLTPAVFSGLKFTYSDDIAPEIEFVDPWGVAYGEVSPWFNGDTWIYYRIDENETFIDELASSLGEVLGVGGSCPANPDGSFAYWCENYQHSLGLLKLPSDLQGSSPLTVSVTDAAGNAAEVSMTVRQDTIAPPAPENLSVGANEAGWVTKPEIVATWANTGETFETESASGIAQAEYELRDAADNLISWGTHTGSAADALITTVNVPGTYKLSVRVRDAAGNASDYSDTTFTYDGVKPVAPGLSSFQTVNAAHSGSLEASWQNVVYHQPSFSGICGYLVSFNSLEHDDPVPGEGVVELPGDALSYAIPAETLQALSDGPRYFHIRAVSCAGTRGDTSDKPVIIDRTPPELSADPADGGWIPVGGKLEISADDSDAGNPMAGIDQLSYRVDEGDWVDTNTSSVQVPIAQGSHTVEFVAVDLAGNIAQGSTGVGVDGENPSAAFDAFDPRDPTLVTGRVSDPDSGVDDAWLEYSPPGSSHWARLPGSTSGDDDVVVSARVPDDESLPPGEYKLRIVARDKAGNTSVVGTDALGQTVSVRLPLRPRSAMTLAVAAGSAAKTTSSLTVLFGKPVEARGVLRDAGGNPIANAAVAIAESISGGPRRQIGVATTDAAGAYRAAVPAGPSRALTARFLGDTLRGSASASATFNVRAKVTLDKVPSRVRSGKRIYFRGKVDPGLASLPRGGARIRIQRREGSRWSGLELSDKTASDGSFEISWRLKTRRALRFEFRAVVDTETGWPYATGYSKSRKLVIR